MEENRPGRLSLIYAVFGTLLGILLIGVLVVTFRQAFGTRLADAQAPDVEAAVVESDAEAAVAEEESTAEESTETAATAATEEEAAATEEEASANVATAAPVAQAEGVAPADVVATFGRATCAACHTISGIPGAVGQVGPDLSNIGVDGATRIDGYSSEEYITESILDPNAFIAPACPSGDCPANVMLQSFADTLSEDDLSNIVGYLSMLGTGEEMTVEEAAPVAVNMDLPPESQAEPFMELDAPDPAMVALGKYLFFDVRLSNNNSRSCATCHVPDMAFTDGEALNQGYPSTAYFRNAPTVLNTVFADYHYRDGRMDGSDMPTLVRDHITEAHFMSNDGRLMVERMRQTPGYNELFQEAFGGEPSFGKVLNAVTAYVSTLNSPAGAYDAALEGDLSGFSEDEAAGFELFTGKAGCSTCHTDQLLSDDGFYNTGIGTDTAVLFEDPERQLTFRRFFRTHGTPNYRNLTEDVGRYAMTLDEADYAAFRTPSLREVGLTAPYMHDGSLATLEDVVNFYNDGGGESQTAGLEALDLSDEEVAQLVAFLESLSSDLPAVEAPELLPYGLMPLGDGEVATAETAAAEEAATEEADTEEAVAAEEDAATEAATEAEEEAVTEEEEAADEEAEAAAPAGPSDMVIASIGKGGCGACHVIPDVPGAIGVVGPDLTTIGVDAATRVEGEDAVTYLHNSLVDPNAFTAEDCPAGPCPAGVMTPNLEDILSAEEIDAIVEYMATLGSEE